MQHDFGVGFGLEDHALTFQRFAQFAKILDDAVMHDGDALGRMRMRIVLGGPAVGGPAGMADAGAAGSVSDCSRVSRSLSLPSARRRVEMEAFERATPAESYRDIRAA